jgi:uncharacterized protein (DUF885 family)
MSPATAKSNAVKNSRFPGAAMTYLIGTHAIWDLRGAVQEQGDSNFSLQSFHVCILIYGAIPVALISDAMMAAESPNTKS